MAIPVIRHSSDFKRREDHPRWKREQSIELFSKLRTKASQQGFILALGGTSLANADGQDCDLMAFAWRKNVDVPRFIAMIKLYSGASEIMDVFATEHGIGAGMMLPDGRLLDLAIWGIKFDAKWLKGV